VAIAKIFERGRIMLDMSQAAVGEGVAIRRSRRLIGATHPPGEPIISAIAIAAARGNALGRSWRDWQHGARSRITVGISARIDRRIE
jgi:hypothetical protein